jgi:hypothetical protein
LNVVVPFVHFRPELRRALEADGIEARFIDTSGWQGYWIMLASMWEAGDTFIVLEQDKFPAPGALHELWECPRAWCTYPVPTRTGGVSPYPALACTKFDASLMRADPDLMTKVGELDLGFGVREWSRLDLAVASFAENITECHWHRRGRVEHRHDG